MGRSGWGVVNSYHAVMLETDFRPDRIILLYEAQYESDINPVVEGMKTIQEEYGERNIEKVRVPNFDMRATRDEIERIIQSLKDSGSEVALNITGGRKALVAGSLLGFSGKFLKHIYYLTIESTEDAAKPYLMIPKRIQLLRDLAQNIECRKDIIRVTDTRWQGLEMSKEFLTVVLNYGYNEHVRLKVRNPLMEMDLMELDLSKKQAHMLTDRAKYSEDLRECGETGWDHPSYSQLRASLCYAGLIDYRSGDEFRKFFVEGYKRQSDPRHASGRWYISLDSNLFYSGFVSCLESLMAANQIRRGELLFVTSEGVVQEIDRNVSDKYGQDWIGSVKAMSGPDKRRFFDEFHNRNTLETRIAKMASSQFHLLVQQPTHDRAKCEPLPHDSEEADRVIVKSLSEFARDKQATVTLLSSDLQMEDHCRNAGNVGCFILEPPNEIPQVVETTDRGLVDLIVSLSLLYGVVDLENTGHIFGEYGGKRSDNYTSHIKVFFDNLHRAKVIENQVKTCKMLLGLGMHS